MTRIHSGLSRILASIGRALSGGAAAPDVPPVGWERRTMHLSNGDLLSVELPISPTIEAGRFGGSLPAAQQAAGRPEGPMPKPTAHALDALGRPTSPLRQPRPDRARPIRNDCPLLVEFLERRAGR